MSLDRSPLSLPPRPPIRCRSTIAGPIAGCACPDASIPAPFRFRRPTSHPRAMGRQALRRSPGTRGSTASWSIRRCRATAASTATSSPATARRRALVASQFARFSGACRMFAPIYRSMTLGAITYAATGGDVTEPAMMAYGDVRDAFRHYMARHNKGRPYVLIGHSQGSLMLQQLIANEIEGKPVARQMKLAIIPGYNLLVPAGKARRRHASSGRRSAPRRAETGCVMTWVSFREKNVPPAGAIFGIADQPGMTVACTNPGAARRDRLGAARQLLERALRSARPRRPDRLVDPGPPADRLCPHRRPRLGALHQRRPARLSARSAPTPTPPTSAPTASAARSGSPACSSPAGACTSPT